MKLYFNIEIVDEYGKVHGRLQREIDDRAAFMGERIADDMRSGLVMNFAQAVDVLKVKEFRRGLLVHAAKTGGEALADHLEDREGWHGLDRQERIESRYRR